MSQKNLHEQTLNVIAERRLSKSALILALHRCEPIPHEILHRRHRINFEALDSFEHVIIFAEIGYLPLN